MASSSEASISILDGSVHSSASSSASGLASSNDKEDASSTNTIRQTKAISRWRAVVLLTLFGTAVIIVTATPIFIKKGEERDFEEVVSSLVGLIRDS